MRSEYVEQRNGGYYVAGTRISLDSVVYSFNEAQSPEASPPKEWAASPGRKGVEKVRIKNYLTMSVLVSGLFPG